MLVDAGLGKMVYQSGLPEVAKDHLVLAQILGVEKRHRRYLTRLIEHVPLSIIRRYIQIATPAYTEIN